jgi:hypothetical protein
MLRDTPGRIRLVFRIPQADALGTLHIRAIREHSWIRTHDIVESDTGGRIDNGSHVGLF